ncbi:MAG: hypothetical protein WC068_16345 [Caulobacter sp.]
MADFNAIRKGIASLDGGASHAASGEDRPKISEIFAPEQHAGALDPNTTIVLGSRGAGKSFWAGVLGDTETRAAAAEAYPHIGLNNLEVRFGYTGLTNDGSVSRQTIDAQIPPGDERKIAPLLWRCVVLRALRSAVDGPDVRQPTIKTMMDTYADPEEWEEACAAADEKLAADGRRILVIFDALDGVAEDWNRLRGLLDSLLEVAWSIRGYRNVRAKLFLRPDQMRDLGLRFVELPKLIAGATNLTWTGPNLYGMLFCRLGLVEDAAAAKAFREILEQEGVSSPPTSLSRMRRWGLAYDKRAQMAVFSRLAGLYMGRSHKKGRTYDWPVNHLADGHGEVTPRSFLMLNVAAARFAGEATNQAINAEGIRHGLREASKVRVDQLGLEFPWIQRVLAPLARLQVPCASSLIASRWDETETIEAVMKRATAGEFLPPFDPAAEGDAKSNLIGRLVRIGVLSIRQDGRYDMPDLFRVAARLLKKGGVAPH